jgi:thioredoxin 1
MEITGIELEEKIKNGEQVVIDFYGSWCLPCTKMKPIYEKVSSENTTTVQMYTMDVDLNKDFVVSLGIRSVPTIKSFSNGQLVDTKVGVLNEEAIKGLITNVLNG